ncbi:MAG: hypothetical protein KF784_01475 [Fimbriimonadaceae bacterium]|nr:hypothetical protein [Fimbriimonadaceae bacterium]
MEEGYRAYALVTMAIAGLLIVVNLFLYPKRGPTSLLLSAALGAFILFQYSLYASLSDGVRYSAIGLMIVLLIIHFMVTARKAPRGKR